MCVFIIFHSVLFFALEWKIPFIIERLGKIGRKVEFLLCSFWVFAEPCFVCVDMRDNKGKYAFWSLLLSYRPCMLLVCTFPCWDRGCESAGEWGRCQDLF